jgi:formyltetrahydrofolate deformylase
VIFLGHCPDNVGLVARISGFFAKHGISLLHLEEHTEQERFFIRIETDKTEALDTLRNTFQQVAAEISMEFQFYHPEQKTRIALFCSQSLHCQLELLSRQLSGAINTDIVCIISNSRSTQEIAKKFSIPFFYTPTRPENQNHEKHQLEILQDFDIDLIVLGRYMKVLSKYFLDQCNFPIINIHHSFLPSFIGGRPYEMAFDRGVKIVGATAHFVTADLDEGPIISQNVLPVSHSFSAEDMKHAGANIEKLVFSEAIEKFTERKIIEWGGRTIVFQ